MSRKKVIRLTEGQIHQIVKKSVSLLLTELKADSTNLTIKGKEIIAIWESTKKFVENSLPPYIYYIGDILSRHGFTVTNSIFGSCWFRKSNVVMHAHIDVDTEEWVLTEYIGLRGQATRVRYINPNEDYELDIDQ